MQFPDDENGDVLRRMEASGFSVIGDRPRFEYAPINSTLGNDMRVLVAAMAWCLTISAHAQEVHASRILVDKSEHKMYVYAGKRIVATFPVSLGVNSMGPKQEEGDRRTPEGRYMLDHKNEASTFFRSIHISYPNAADLAAAKRRGVRPGGGIMVHGQPDDPAMAKRVRAYPFLDWTNGCIALSNENMQRLWDMVRVPTPIEIVP